MVYSILYDIYKEKHENYADVNVYIQQTYKKVEIKHRYSEFQHNTS